MIVLMIKLKSMLQLQNKICILKLVYKEYNFINFDI